MSVPNRCSLKRHWSPRHDAPAHVPHSGSDPGPGPALAPVPGRRHFECAPERPVERRLRRIADLRADARTALSKSADFLKSYPTIKVTIEGHCDERGTAEYNLALGERRAVAARAYLIAQGISADRLRIVSYGKEFPFDPGHDESAFAKNRRAHFVITAK